LAANKKRINAINTKKKEKKRNNAEIRKTERETPKKLSSIEDRGQTERVTALPRQYTLTFDLDPRP